MAGGVGLLDAARSALVVVDLQERLMPAIAGGAAVVARAEILLEAARVLEIPVIATEQYPKGLGATVGTIAARLPNDAPVIEKLTFSAARSRDFAAALGVLQAAGRDQVVVCGTETHVCVMQTVADLAGAGSAGSAGSAGKTAGVFVVEDACGSRAPASKDAALARFRQMGVSCVTTEMAVFEWLGAAGTPAFKTLSTLIK